MHEYSFDICHIGRYYTVVLNCREAEGLNMSGSALMVSQPALGPTQGSAQASTEAEAKCADRILSPCWRESDDAQPEFALHRLVARYADYRCLAAAKWRSFN